ncbi:MAG: DMT family transporter [Roseiarcus sp.]|jgi:drug/metabolite transporter (DMT)-like permease
MTEIPAKARALRSGLWSHPTLLLSLTALMFAGHSVAGRLAVGEISPMTLTCARWGLALIPLGLARRGHFARDLAILRGRWMFTIAMGALGLTAFNALFYTAAHRTSALNLSILQGAIPAFVLIGARLVFGAKVRNLQAFGAFVTMVGVVAIASRGDLARLLALGFNGGDLMMVLACVFYAGYTVGLRDRPTIGGLGFFAALAAVAFVTSIPLLGVEIAGGGFIQPSGKGIAVLLYAALFPSLIAQIFFMRGVELIGPGRAGVFVNLVPVFGALLAVLLLGEAFAPYHAVALVLVVAGITIAERSARPAAEVR